MPDYTASALNSLTGLGGLGSFNHLGDVNASNLANMQSHLTAAQVRCPRWSSCALCVVNGGFCSTRVWTLLDDDCALSASHQVNALGFNPAAVGLGSLHANSSGGHSE
jgi:hypothetical protein